MGVSEGFSLAFCGWVWRLVRFGWPLSCCFPTCEVDSRTMSKTGTILRIDMGAIVKAKRPKKEAILLYSQQFRGIIPVLFKTENPVSCANNQQGLLNLTRCGALVLSAVLFCLRRLTKTRSTIDIRE